MVFGRKLLERFIDEPDIEVADDRDTRHNKMYPHAQDEK